MKAAARLILLMGVFASCATITPTPSALDAERSGVPLATLLQGRALFVGRCGSCHRTPDPGSLSAMQWAKVLPEMLDDAKLNPKEAAQVLAFLQALAQPSDPVPDAHAERG